MIVPLINASTVVPSNTLPPFTLIVPYTLDGKGGKAWTSEDSDRIIPQTIMIDMTIRSTRPINCLVELDIDD
jgi:hypothetical protein